MVVQVINNNQLLVKDLNLQLLLASILTEIDKHQREVKSTLPA